MHTLTHSHTHTLTHSHTYTHIQGIVHRDIKPSNVLLNAEEQPRLLIADFSSAFMPVSASFHARKLYAPSGPSIAEQVCFIYI
jgi:serine/threonine protein kinase